MNCIHFFGRKLKERVTQLDLENTALARAANSRTIQNVEELNDPAEIKETILKLKGLLKLANEQSEKPVDIDGMGRYCGKCFHVYHCLHLHGGGYSP